MRLIIRARSGRGCSDPYSSGLNNVVGNGGPKWQVNAATGLFPSQEMEDAFKDYLAWTKTEGLSRLAAFEPVVRDFPEGQGSLSGRFPNQAMEDQFKEYLAWTGEGHSGLFYAFRAVEFN